jgi:soluble lytic murein transglycosylase-like protein
MTLPLIIFAIAIVLIYTSQQGDTTQVDSSGGNMSIQDMITTAASKYGVDPKLALALATEESALNPSAVSSVGAVGIYQLMPATSDYFGVTDPTDPAQNIDAGVHYLSMVMSQFGGNVSAALTALDWGPANVTKVIAMYGDSWIDNIPAEAIGVINKVNKILSSL